MPIIVIFCLGFFLRFYNLSNIPSGLYADETAIGYNAYSILQTGKDEYGVSYPLYFRSFDDYKMPVYIYMTVLTIKAFGANAFAIRFPSALFGSLAIIALFFLIYELSKNKKIAIISSLFLTINPWHIFFSRAGYEVNVATTLLVIGTLFFIMAINRKNNLLFFIISIIAFLISLYTYNITRIIAPLIFLMLIVLYYKNITTVSKKLLVGLLALFFIGMLPFLITLVTLQSQAGFSSQQDALITGKVTRAEIMQTRSYFVFLPGIIQKVFLNYWVLLVWKFLSNLVSFFSTGFFFTTGSDHPNENIGGFGMFYYFDFPLMLFGAYQGLRKKVKFLYPFYLWFVLLLFIGAIVVNHVGTRTYPAIIPLVVFSSYGMYVFLEKMLNLKNTLIKRSAILVSVGIIAFSCLFYLTSYFIRFPIEYAKEWHAEDLQTVNYIASISKNYNKIVFDDSSQFIYTYFLFYAKYPPLLHQQQAVYVPDGLVDRVVKDGKYEFRKVDWGKELSSKKTLFITGKDNVPNNVKPLAIFTYPTRPVVIFYDRKIAQYPVTDVAYEIFQSNP